MHELKEWVIKSSGGFITIIHSTGKITKVVGVSKDTNVKAIVATALDGREYRLS
jgi:hypothetical protein